MNSIRDEEKGRGGGKWGMLKTILEIVTSISTLISLLASPWNWFFGLPAWIVWCAIALAITSALSWLGLWFWSQPRRNQPDADPLDVESMMGGGLSETRDPVPLVAASEAELKPLFHAYTGDDIDDLHWTWKWRPEAADPLPDAIEALACFCPKCGLRITPKEESRSRQVSRPRDNRLSLARLPDRTYTVSDPFCSFACDKACFQANTRPGDLADEHRRIRNLIEQRAKGIMAKDNAQD
jgi:hypothetical protein